MLQDKKWWYVIPITSRKRMDILIEDYQPAPNSQEKITVDINDNSTMGSDVERVSIQSSSYGDRDLEDEASEEATSFDSLNIFIDLLDNENDNFCINIFYDDLHDPYTLIDSVADNLS